MRKTILTAVLTALLLVACSTSKTCEVPAGAQAEIRYKPTMQSRIASVLEAGTVIELTGEASGDWLEVDGGGWVKADTCK